MIDLADQHFVLLPYQRELLADQSRVRIVEKSRRIGISWVLAVDCVLDAASADGQDAWYVGYNKDMAIEFIRDVAWWARQLGSADPAITNALFADENEDKHILTYTVRFASGFRVTALSSRPSNLRNKRGHIIIDEAAHHDRLPELLKAAFAIVMWGGRARVDIISSHSGIDNEFNKVIEDVRAGRRPYSLHRITLDDALAQGLFKRIALVNHVEWSSALETEWRAELFRTYGDDAQEELLCVPSRSGGTYIARGLIERQMRDGLVLRLQLDDDFVTQTEGYREAFIKQWCADNLAAVLTAMAADRMHFFGVDFGRASDRSVIVVGRLSQKLVRQFTLAIELGNVPFEQQRQILFYVVDRLPNLSAGALDATGNGAFLAEVAMQRYGNSVIKCVELSERWYHEHLPPFKASFEDERIEVLNDLDHLLDLCAFKVLNGVPKLPKTKSQSKSGGPPRHGDAGIAYLLAHFASQQPLVEYAYQHVPSRPTLRDLRMVLGGARRTGLI